LPPHSKLRVLATGIADDGLKYLAFVERADDSGDHVHQRGARASGASSKNLL
jgi:hypothetical protein